MRLDAHQHFWSYDAAQYPWIPPGSPLHRSWLPADLAALQQPLGFDGAIAVQARQVVGESDWLLGPADTHANVKGVVGWVDLRSDRGFFGSFQRGTVTPANTVTGSRPAGVATTQLSATGVFFFVPTAPGAATRTIQATTPDRTVGSPVGEYYMNVNDFRFLIPATRRHNLYTSLDHEFGKDLTFFSDLTYYRADSHNEREPSRIDGTADNNIFVSAGNPYNPFGTRFYDAAGAPNADGTARITGTPSDVVLSRVTLPEFGARKIDVRSETMHALAGLRGRVSERWNWESAVLYSRAETTDLESNAIKESQLRDAAQRTNSTSPGITSATKPNAMPSTLRIDRPTTSGSSSSAEATICSGVSRMPL